ncbi:MAG TPA: flagellar basal body rod protein FlgC [Gemmatimonadaceae bacterium]|nr:flagellar basal body rod protein FlgC [Gemmatimonadaceae bacterium]
MANPINPAAPPMFSTLRIASSGLSGERLRMDVIATNIANADTTRTPDGGPYRRRVVQMESADSSQFASQLESRVRTVVEDPTPGNRVYEPGHPDADADGYVTYPNVNVTQEIVDLMDARRLFEANATVFQVTKALLNKSLEI